MLLSYIDAQFLKYFEGVLQKKICMHTVLKETPQIIILYQYKDYEMMNSMNLFSFLTSAFLRHQNDWLKFRQTIWVSNAISDAK